ncbi:hypothetical protein D3C85_726410 [compost metagenome]
MSKMSAGYESWIEWWVLTGAYPSVSDCPARHMAEGSERSEFLKGWMKARNEFLEENHPVPRPHQAS